MALVIAVAFAAGALVTLSRQLNGRLALGSSTLGSSFWNHIIGLGTVVLYGMVAGGLWPEGMAEAPWYARVGGTFGVVFVASGSWLIPRLGAAMTGGLLVAGQMIFGVLMDLLRYLNANTGLQLAGIALILGGVAISRREPKRLLETPAPTERQEAQSGER